MPFVSFSGLPSIFQKQRPPVVVRAWGKGQAPQWFRHSLHGLGAVGGRHFHTCFFQPLNQLQIQLALSSGWGPGRDGGRGEERRGPLPCGIRSLIDSRTRMRGGGSPGDSVLRSPGDRSPHQGEGRTGPGPVQEIKQLFRLLGEAVGHAHEPPSLVSVPLVQEEEKSLAEARIMSMTKVQSWGDASRGAGLEWGLGGTGHRGPHQRKGRARPGKVALTSPRGLYPCP